MNSFYNHTDGIPANQTRGISSSIRSEFDLVQMGFDLTTVALAAKGAISGQSWTGSHDFTGSVITAPTKAAGDNSTNVATTAYVEASAAILTAADALKAPIASPSLTGIPTAPTAAGGTNTTQIATTEFVNGVAMSAVLPVQSGNAGKYITTDGFVASWSTLQVVGSVLYSNSNLGGF